MREVIFRGKRVDNGEWVEGFYIRFVDEHHYILVPKLDANGECSSLKSNRVDPATVGQYTGLKDRNGKRIFEGDVVGVVSLNNDHCQRGASRILYVRYLMGNPCVCYPGFESGTPLYPLCVGYSVKVIGNIHDNPELLEGGVNDG